MAKDRFVEVYSQGVTNVEKIIVDTQTGVNYVLASSALTAGCGMSILVDADGKPIMIFKNPKTDTGHFKKSQRGCCRVVRDGDNYTYEDGLTWAETQENNELQVVFKNGEFIKTYTLDEVRQNLHGGRF